MAQKNYRPHYEHIKNKWTERHREVQKAVLEKHIDAFRWLNHHVKNFAIGSLGTLLVATQQPSLAPKGVMAVQEKEVAKELNKDVFLVYDLSNKVPSEVRPLNIDEEQRVAELLSTRFGFSVAAELEGKRLNRSYGLIGAEQHLARYPGDSMITHFDPPAGGAEESSQYFSSGMAPGLGAWRYFAPSKAAMTEKDSLKEKYYVAVQTFLAPGFHDNVREFSEFFKFRKMLVVNPQNGKAVVAVIGDAGPAEWTGKHLGGSPEVMSYLKRVDGKGVGPVLYFFIDDPEDKIPLGPIHVQ